MEGEQEIYNQTEKAIDGFAEWTQAKDRSGAAKEINDYKKIGNRDLRFSPEGFDNLKEVMVSANPALKDVDVKKAYTFEFLDKLKELGFPKTIGVPGT
jgi:hypothetical protein